METMMWLGPLVLIAAAIAFAVFDTFWPITVGVAAGIVLGWWFGRLDDARPVLHLWMAVPYVLIGIAWTFFKWTRLVDDAFENRPSHGPPQWRQHSYDFAAYFFYWPLDVAAYVLTDLLRDVWSAVAAMIAQSFDRYARWRFERGRRAAGRAGREE
jgi:hypothetical protein